MLNSISLVGRLTRDPELRRTNSGTAVGNFTVAVDEGRKDSNGEKMTLFMDCSLFGNQVDVLAKYFRKGNLIALCGRLVSRKYTNNQGVNVTAYSVNCDHIEFVESTAQMNASAGGQAEQNKEQPKAQPTAAISEKQNLESIDVDDSDLPF